MHLPKSLAAIAALFLWMAARPHGPPTRSPCATSGSKACNASKPGTVFSTLGIKAGDNYSDERGSAAIRALFELGLFKDVRIDIDGNVLVVIVEERPTVADVDFAGTKEFDKAALQKALREIGLAEGRPFDKALADRAEQELKRQYVSRSLYNAEVVTTVTPLERNRVNLTFTVVEGESARIKSVRVSATRPSAKARCSTCSTRTAAAGSPGTPSRTSIRAASSPPTRKRCAPTTSRAAT
jgi:outer membrane protein insertion porin family